MPVKPTYPHSSISLVPEGCRNKLEPCCLPKPGCYSSHISHGISLVIDELLEKGTTRSPNAWLVLEHPDYNLWKFHWQRGRHCGPGHCVAIFQYKNSNQPYEGHEDYTTHSCYSIPGGCLALDTTSLSSSASPSSESLTRRLPRQ
nr:NS7b protein [Deltacoronavirus sp.]WBG67165.1 NS7b protein [Deltacoronavirus sp.]